MQHGDGDLKTRRKYNEKKSMIAKFKHGVHPTLIISHTIENGRTVASQIAHKKNTDEIHLHPNMSLIVF